MTPSGSGRATATFVHRSRREPHVYSFQDVAEAIVVHELLDREVTHKDFKGVIRNTRDTYGGWTPALSLAGAGAEADDCRW